LVIFDRLNCIGKAALGDLRDEPGDVDGHGDSRQCSGGSLQGFRPTYSDPSHSFPPQSFDGRQLPKNRTDFKRDEPGELEVLFSYDEYRDFLGEQEKSKGDEEAEDK
jgi:hypothetical protein